MGKCLDTPFFFLLFAPNLQLDANAHQEVVEANRQRDEEIQKYTKVDSEGVRRTF